MKMKAYCVAVVCLVALATPALAGPWWQPEPPAIPQHATWYAANPALDGHKVSRWLDIGEAPVQIENTACPEAR